MKVNIQRHSESEFVTSGVERNLSTWKQRLLEMDNKRRTWRMEHQSSDRGDGRGEGRDRGGYGRGGFGN
jgi:hypothetical protein